MWADTVIEQTLDGFIFDSMPDFDGGSVACAAFLACSADRTLQSKPLYFMGKNMHASPLYAGLCQGRAEARIRNRNVAGLVHCPTACCWKSPHTHPDWYLCDITVLIDFEQVPRGPVWFDLGIWGVQRRHAWHFVGKSVALQCSLA